MKKIKFIFLIAVALLAAILSCACSKARLASPTWVTIDDELNLNWEEIDSARSYVVEVKSLADDTVEQKKTKSNSLSLESLEEGDYELKVKAVADERKNSDSLWTSVTEMHKDKENGCIYKLINNSTEYKLVKYGTSSGTVVIEDVFRNKPVTLIDTGAFRGSSKIEEVYINGESITDIGDYAFYNCQNLTKVVISDSVKSIGVRAFQSCRKLVEVNIPSGVKTISEYAFNYCTSLPSIVIPEGVTTIEKSAFTGCYSLKEVTLPDSLVTLGESAFSSCYNTKGEVSVENGLQKITFGKGLTEIGESAFSDNSALVKVVFGEQSSLRTISSHAFDSCLSLEKIELPSGLTKIASYAFYNCTKLNSIVIPSTVSSVGYSAFVMTAFYNKATLANEPYIYADNWLVGVSEDVFSLSDITSNTSSSEVSVFLRSDIVGIADAVFSRSSTSTTPSSIEKVYLPNSVKYIGNSTFANNKKMTRFYANPTQSKLISIDEYAFYNCQALNKLTLPNGLKTIGLAAFMYCTVLENNDQNPIIPSSVTSIGSYAFYNTKLWNSPDDSGVIYAGSWVVGFNSSKLEKSITIAEGTAGISNYAFYQADVSTVNASAVSYVGEGAFYECSNLNVITFNSNIDEIGNFAFYKCEKLQKVTFPSMLTRIGRSTFYKCTSLYEIDLKKTKIEQIDSYAFYGCTSLKDVKLCEGLTSIGDYAFHSNTALETLNIPSTVEKIGKRSFYKATSLTSLTFDKDKNEQSSISEIDDYAFYGATSLSTLTIPASVKTIGRMSFYGCENIYSLKLSEGVEAIGDYAFFKLNSIKSLVLPSSLKSVGKFAFSYFYIETESSDTAESDSSSTSDSSSQEAESFVIHSSSVTSVLVKNSIVSMGAHVFYGYGNATFYTDASELPGKWDKYWNSSFRPVVWGCKLSEDSSYVVSFTKTQSSISNPRATNGISDPIRDGYTFLGWSTAYGSLTAEYTSAQIVGVADNTTLYAVWQVA